MMRVEMNAADYRKTVEFSGDPGRALSAGRSILMPLGYEIKPLSQTSFEAFGPGMMSSRQNAILGASYLRIVCEGRTLSMNAELGGIKRMKSFLMIFLSSMALLFMILFGALFWKKAPYVVFIAVAPFLPWVFLLPVIIKGRQSTWTAI